MASESSVITTYLSIYVCNIFRLLVCVQFLSLFPMRNLTDWVFEYNISCSSSSFFFFFFFSEFSCGLIDRFALATVACKKREEVGRRREYELKGVFRQENKNMYGSLDCVLFFPLLFLPSCQLLLSPFFSDD